MPDVRPIPTLTERKLLSLEKKANLIRQDLLTMLEEAGSGHSAGPLGMADIFTALYFHVLHHNPKNPSWNERDRLYLSCGHIAPIRYATMAHAGYFPKSTLKTLRKLGSPLQGHPEYHVMPSLENTSGPLGDGSPQSTGAAYVAKMDEEAWHTYCILSDGELEAGITWEAALFASRNQLYNLTWIVDRNNIQIDGYTEDIMPLEPLREKFEAFNFEVIDIDGHNIREFVDACNYTRTIWERPCVILAHTIPGKGVDFMEFDYKWHGAPPGKGTEDKVKKDKQLTEALKDLRTLGGKITSEASNMAKNPSPKLARNWKKRDALKQEPTRNGYGEGLVESGKKDKNVYAICADLSESTRTHMFKEAFPDRFVQLGVSEQALATIAAGMALNGKTVWIASYAAFSPGRNWEQIRTTACLQRTNVKIAGAHAGVSVGPDGATHQMLEDIALMRVLPEMTVLVPCDKIETKKAVIAASKMSGPVYVRFAREKSPIFTTESTPFKVGKAQVFRDGNDVAIIGCGPLVYECLIAAEELEKEGINARVINNVSVKPMDEKTILQAAKDCGAVVTVEEAQAAGGMGSAVCELLSEELPTPVERIGMQDRFGESGEPQELLEHFNLTAPGIITAVKKVIKKKR